jgi:hypothetical protein
MKNASPFAPSAATAANDPQTDRPESHARPDDFEAMGIEWQLGMLRELAEIGMEMARDVRDEAVAEPAPDQPGQPSGKRDTLALAFSRISRAVRMTLALYAKLVEDHRLLGDQIATERKQRADAARTEHRAHQRDKVTRVVEATLDAKAGKNESERERLEDEFREQLQDFDDYALCGQRSIGEIIARICRDLGVTPDWKRWVDAAWAIDEIATKPPGSPYANFRPAAPVALRPTASSVRRAASGRDPPADAG